MLLEAENIFVQYGLRTVLDIDKFYLEEGECVGLVGENGAGKTTLLRILGGRTAGGKVKTYADVAAIHQMDGPDGEADPALLQQWSVPENEKMSGGEYTRLRIAAALSRPSSILLADEPTSNLDLQGVEWLQKRLMDWQGGIVLISHDRALLDALCTRICLLEDGHLRSFPGNYSRFLEQCRMEREYAQEEYDKYRQEKARLESAIGQKLGEASRKHSTPGRMGNSEARLHKMRGQSQSEKVGRQMHALQTRLEHMEVKERPRDEQDIRMAMGEPGKIFSPTAARAERVSFAYGEHQVLRDVSFIVPTGKRTVLMGNNGAGKSTLLSLFGKEQIRLAADAKPGLFDQKHEQLRPGNTILESVMESSARPEWAARTVLARLGIRGDDVHKKVHMLSGGERAKTMLARLLVSDANFLLMDEPTNYLDLAAMEALNEMLCAYSGTLLLITHDRRLCDACAQRLLWLENGEITTFEGGGYSAWKESKRVKQDASVLDTQIMLLQLRMAKLNGQIDQANAEQKAEMEKELLQIAREIRGLEQQKEKQRPSKRKRKP